MNKGDNRAVNVFYNRCLRKILRIRWQDHVGTKEQLERAGMKPMSVEVISRSWKMIGHILIGKIAMMIAMLLWAGPQKVVRKRRRLRPKTTWGRKVERERQEAGWRSWEEVRTAATNREEGKSSMNALCATRHEEDRWRWRSCGRG